LTHYNQDVRHYVVILSLALKLKFPLQHSILKPLITTKMSMIRFYNPVPAYRDENASEAYEKLMHHFSVNNACGCHQGNAPAANISENETSFRIEMALPGVDKKHISLKQENGFLSISVEGNGDENAEEYTRREFNYSGTTRTFRTGEKIDTGNISARFENGILSVHLPKKEAFVSRPAQQIAVE
jgi:HSP20 family protein